MLKHLLGDEGMDSAPLTSGWRSPPPLAPSSPPVPSWRSSAAPSPRDSSAQLFSSSPPPLPLEPPSSDVALPAGRRAPAPPYRLLSSSAPCPSWSIALGSPCSLSWSPRHPHLPLVSPLVFLGKRKISCLSPYRLLQPASSLLVWFCAHLWFHLIQTLGKRQTKNEINFFFCLNQDTSKRLRAEHSPHQQDPTSYNEIFRASWQLCL